MNIKWLHFLFAIVIAGLLGYWVGVSQVNVQWKNYKPNVTVTGKEPPAQQQNVDFSLFWTVWEKLQDSYYDKTVLDPQKMLNGAIAGMVDSIGDPYTVFLPPVRNTDFKQGLAGQFEGIGAELGLKGKQIVVVEPLGGMPAVEAGIRPADTILKVNGDSTDGWTLTQAVEKIRGPKGTKVLLTVLHQGETKPVDVSIVRNTIQVKSVDGWVKKIKDIPQIHKENLNGDSEIAYVRLSQFGDNTNQEWLVLINKLALNIKQNDGSVKGMILDLRNNPGGYLTDATFIASEFLKDGTVVIEDRGNGEQNPFTVNRKGILLDIPLVVLVNKGSASASEIVAGALRDHNRAQLIGETSFGKGTIQQAEDLGNGAGLHITIAKWLTPNGTWVHGKGLTPDVTVKLDAKDPAHDVQLEKAIQELLH